MSERWSYLWHLRIAAVPVIAITAWLVAADHLAISAGIWHFGEGKILGVRLGTVPVEEALFFLTTNALVAGGTILLDGLAGRRATR
jgi:lycopene cyclase domain-containing protein